MNLFWKRANKQDATLLQKSELEEPAFAVDCANTPSEPQSTLRDRNWNVEFANETEVAAAASRFEQPDVETVADLLADRGPRARRGAVYWVWTIMAPALALASFVGLLNGDLAWVCAGLFGLMTAGVLRRQAALIDRERAALRNSQLGTEWLGALSEALEWPERRVRGTAATLLAQLLPHVNESELDRFAEEQRACLYRRLTPFEALCNPELALAILRALSQLGTEPALPYVERLAAGRVVTAGGRRVREAALATLTLLERRIARQRDMESALRHELPADECGSSGPLRSDGGCERTDAEMAAVTARVDAQMKQFEWDLRKLQRPGMRLGFLIASWAIIVPYAAVQALLQFAGGHWPAGLLFSVMTVLSTQLYRLTMTGQHKLIARNLARMDDVRCIGRLAEFLEWPDAAVRYFAIPALNRLLTRVKATDSVLLTPRQRGNLYRMLILSNAARHAELLVNILKALQQVGDVSAVPYVEQLAKALPSSARQTMVCTAARDCLPYVKVRSELSRSSQTLLRASSMTAAGGESLVRPVNVAGATDAEQLLRAGSGNGSA